MIDIRVIFVSSPDRRQYQSWQTVVPIQAKYMPGWSLEELELFRVGCHPNTTASTLQQRYSLVGGKPRLIFGPESYDQLIAEIKNACKGYVHSSSFNHMIPIVGIWI
jgi:hypothetical protein